MKDRTETLWLLTTHCGEEALTNGKTHFYSLIGAQEEINRLVERVNRLQRVVDNFNARIDFGDWKGENLVDAVMYDIELVESDKMPPAEIDLRKNSGIEDCH